MPVFSHHHSLVIKPSSSGSYLTRHCFHRLEINLTLGSLCSHVSRVSGMLP
jgi:hypothetical protein